MFHFLDNYSARFTYLFCVVLIMATLNGVTKGQVAQTIILEGGQAPGLDSGVIFEQFNLPRLGTNGEMAFHAKLSGTGISRNNDWSVWTLDSRGLNMVAQEGDLAPGLEAGQVFREAPSPGSNDNNSPFHAISRRSLLQKSINTSYFAFEADYMEGTDDYREGVWISNNGSVSLFGASGSQAPGLEAGTTINGTIVNEIRNAPNGQFYVSLNVRTAGDDPQSSRVWWRGDADGLEVVYRTGGPVPGQSNAKFTGLEIENVVNNGYFGSYRIERDDASIEEGIGRSIDGHWSSIVKVGESVAGLPSDVQFGGLGSSFVFHSYSPTMNEKGEVAFAGFITGGNTNSDNNSVLFVGGAENFRAVAREQEVAIGMESAKHIFLADPVINANSTFAFGSALVDGEVPDFTKGIWLGNDESVELIALEGNQAPGMGPNVRFDRFREYSIAQETDRLLFYADLEGEGITESNKQGLWLFENGNLRNLVQTGDMINLGPGQGMGRLLSITAILQNTGSHKAWIDETNNRVVFDGQIAGGIGSGIFYYSLAVPEPGSGLLLVGIFTVWGLRRHRK